MLLRFLILMCILLSTKTEAQIKISSVRIGNQPQTGQLLIEWTTPVGNGAMGPQTYSTGHATIEAARAQAIANASGFVAQQEDLVKNQVGYINGLVATATTAITNYNTGSNTARSTPAENAIAAVYNEVNATRGVMQTLKSNTTTVKTQHYCTNGISNNVYSSNPDGSCSFGTAYKSWVEVSSTQSQISSVNSILPN